MKSYRELTPFEKERENKKVKVISGIMLLMIMIGMLLLFIPKDKPASKPVALNAIQIMEKTDRFCAFVRRLGYANTLDECALAIMPMP
jgi:hypothetical protein